MEEYEEKEPVDIEFIEQNLSWNDENVIDIRWSGAQEEEDEEDIALASFIESLQKQTDEENFPKSNWMIVWWLRYCT